MSIRELLSQREVQMAEYLRAEKQRRIREILDENDSKLRRAIELSLFGKTLANKISEQVEELELTQFLEELSKETDWSWSVAAKFEQPVRPKPVWVTNFRYTREYPDQEFNMARQTAPRPYSSQFGSDVDLVHIGPVDLKSWLAGEQPGFVGDKVFGVRSEKLEPQEAEIRDTGVLESVGGVFSGFIYFITSAPTYKRKVGRYDYTATIWNEVVLDFSDFKALIFGKPLPSSLSAKQLKIQLVDSLVQPLQVEFHDGWWLTKPHGIPYNFTLPPEINNRHHPSVVTTNVHPSLTLGLDRLANVRGDIPRVLTPEQEFHERSNDRMRREAFDRQIQLNSEHPL